MNIHHLPIRMKSKFRLTQNPAIQMPLGFRATKSGDIVDDKGKKFDGRIKDVIVPVKVSESFLKLFDARRTS